MRRLLAALAVAMVLGMRWTLATLAVAVALGMRRTLAAVAVAVALGGCGEKPEPPAPAAVTGTVDLPRPAAGAPDAGTTAGHRAPDAAGKTSRSTFAFRGRVRPTSARVTLRGSRRTAVDVVAGARGRFRARVRGLRRGTNAFVLEARAPGLEPWTVDVAVTRR